MSNYNGHRNAGLVGSAIVGISLLMLKNKYSEITSYEIIIPCISVFAFALFPDIDIKSTPSKFFYRCIAVILGYCYYMSHHSIGNLIGLLAILPQLTKHRGIFHHPITAVLLPGSVFYLYHLNIITIRMGLLVYLSSVFGYFIHLLMDMKKSRK